MFWDSSALVPLLVAEQSTAALSALFAEDKAPVIWWCAPVECRSALLRVVRERPATKDQVEAGIDRLRMIRARVGEMAPTEDIRSRALRLLSAHRLRAADACQLAAALGWCEEQPSGEDFVCLDARLRAAAAREGFTVRPT